MDIAAIKAKLKMKRNKEGVFLTLDEEDLQFYFGKSKKEAIKKNVEKKTED